MSTASAPLEPKAFLKLGGNYEGEAPLPRGFELGEADAIIDRALKDTRRLVDQMEEAQNRLVDAALAAAESAPGASTQTVEAQTVASQPLPPPPRPSAPRWEPTHVAPSSGLPAWREPDPALRPTTDLPPRLPLRVLRVVNGWAQVKTAVGRSWWVDAARLEQINPPRYDAGSPPRQPRRPRW